MAAVDLFCAPDDQHRVVLLVDLLKEAGRAITLRTEPVAVPSNPCIVACTVRSLREPWIVTLFETAPALVAVRLDDTPLPAPCARSIGLQNWPARSADRKVGALVEWLLRHGPPLEVAGPRAAADAAVLRGTALGAAPEPPRRRPRDHRAQETRRNLLVLTFLVAGGALLWWAAPERGGGAAQTAAQTAAMVPEVSGDGPLVAGAGEQADGASTAIAAGGAAAAGTDAAAGVAAAAGIAAARAAGSATAAPDMVTAMLEPESATVPAGHFDGSAAPDSQATRKSSPPVAREFDRPQAASRHPTASDALAHLCEARTPAAARAWAGVLDWKQRRRLPDEPCVARLLARPGFDQLASLLD